MSRIVLALLIVTLLSANSLAFGQAAQDVDGDGIPDAWEIAGFVNITLPDGRSQKLDLTSDGPLSPDHKDVLIWITWMEDATHTHKPDAKALQIVKTAFANAPIANSDGTQGIRLHIFFSPTPLPESQLLGNWNGASYDWTSFDARKSRIFPKELLKIFRFCVFAHDIDPIRFTSGISRGIGSYDFIVALGSWAPNGGVVDATSQAGTLMHELGHNLGLRHGGVDDFNYKPNYLSIMNYYYQMSGLTIDLSPGHYDYSRFRTDIDEGKLDEQKGINAAPKWSQYGVQWFCSAQNDKSQTADSVNGPIDWNCNGDIEDKQQISQDINNDGHITPLNGFDDWSNIKLTGYDAADQKLGATPPANAGHPLTSELTLRQANAIPLPPVAHVRVDQIGSGVSVAWSRLPVDRVVGYKVLRATEGSKEMEIGTTSGPGFVDTSAITGSHSYSVLAMYTPYGTAASAIPTVYAASTGKIIYDEAAITQLRNILPGIRQAETAGTKRPIAGVADRIRILLETAASKPASIVVK